MNTSFDYLANPARLPSNLLFHCTNSNALFKIIESGCFRGGRIINMNDLREAELCEQFRFYNMDLFNTIKEQCYSFSFSQNFKYPNSDIVFYGFKKPRMWAQYADNNQGVCLVFEKDKFKQELLQHSEDYDIYYGSIEYKIMLEDFLGTCSCEDVKNYIQNNCKELFFTKHFDWRDEDEYKFIAISKMKDTIKVPNVNIRKCLIGIIMAPRFNYKAELIYQMNKGNFDKHINLYTSYGKFGGMSVVLDHGWKQIIDTFKTNRLV